MLQVVHISGARQDQVRNEIGIGYIFKQDREISMPNGQRLRCNQPIGGVLEVIKTQIEQLSDSVRCTWLSAIFRFV